jgi:hypothetical protein
LVAVGCGWLAVVAFVFILVLDVVDYAVGVECPVVEDGPRVAMVRKRKKWHGCEIQSER